MLKYYDKILLDNDIVMSCDMLRLSFSMIESIQSKFNQYINMYEMKHSNIKVKYYNSLQLFQFRNIVQIQNLIDGTSFAMGLGFNSATNQGKTTCFIEFNPNKTMPNYLVNPFLDFIKSHCHNIDVVRYDIAFDIPLPRELFALVKDRRKYKKIYSLELNNKNMSDFTEYLGVRQNNGYVKLYNKQIESNLDSALTRLEITLDKLDYTNLITEMPVLNIFTYNQSNYNTLNDTERVLLTLLLNSDNTIQYLNSLGRYMKDKLQPFIADSFPINITESDFYHFITLINKIIN